MSEIISNVESVTTAAKIVSAQKVETSQLCIDGKDLQVLKEERAPSYKELVTRMELPEDEIWALYTDNGDIIYWHNADKMDTNLANNAFEGSGFSQLPRGLNYEKMTKCKSTFANCNNLKIVYQDFNELETADSMFYLCSNLEKFEGDLGKLQNSNTMFHSCRELFSFKSNLDSLQDGTRMFPITPKLTNFNVPLPKLEKGEVMFAYSGLTSFNVTLESLVNGRNMFYDCSSLTSFASKLKTDDAEYSPLIDGTNMFTACKLDAPSVENILTSLQPFTDGSEHIMTMRIQSAAVEKFNEITGNTLTLNRQYQNVPFRGWTVQVAII